MANVHAASQGSAPLHWENIAHRLLGVDIGLDTWGSWLRKLWEDNGLHQVMTQNTIQVEDGPAHSAIHRPQQATNCGNRIQPSACTNSEISNVDDSTLPMAAPSSLVNNTVQSSQLHASNGPDIVAMDDMDEDDCTTSEPRTGGQMKSFRHMGDTSCIILMCIILQLQSTT